MQVGTQERGYGQDEREKNGKISVDGRRRGIRKEKEGKEKEK